MMADSFTYDLISFLRVIYKRRWFIVKGAAACGVAAMILSLVLPETWRANGRVGVSTPAYKSQLSITDQQGFDVNWYEGILNSDSLFFEIIDTFKWLHTSIHHLLDTEAINRLKENLNEKAATLTNYQLIENTNLRVLTELLLDESEKEDLLMQKRISILGHLSGEDIEEIFYEDINTYDKLTVHDLRQDLSTHVAVLVDTNLEKVYSKNISVSAESSTANSAKMLTNIWLQLFEARAEQAVRSIFSREVELQKQRAAHSEQTLATAEKALKTFDGSNPLGTIRTEIKSKQVLLYGGSERNLSSVITDEEFDVTDETKPYATQTRTYTEDISFQQAEHYEKALIPKKNELETAIAHLQQKGNKEPDIIILQLELNAINSQITALVNSLKTLNQQLQNKETERNTLMRRVEEAQLQREKMLPLLAEAQLLDSGNFDQPYSDASIYKAIKPDKRIFPRRSLMSLLGGFLGVLLFIGLAFFEDIWTEVIREEEPAPEPAAEMEP
jgi:uncharacterized protein involved in exopolysaccharide biosynthesis